MAAEARTNLEPFRNQIKASLKATREIREIIKSTELQVQNPNVLPTMYYEINRTMLSNISNLHDPLNALMKNMQNQGGMDENSRKIKTDILKILSQYRIVEEQLGIIDSDILDVTDNNAEKAKEAKNDINKARAESIGVLNTMETDLNEFYIKIAGQPMQSEGGYRKRKQRTQRKQRKQHKQKHRKTHRKTLKRK